MSTLKKCKECDTDLPLNAFADKKGGKYGKRSICKECTTSLHREPFNYAKAMYKAQQQRTKLKGLPTVSYSKEDFTQWVLSHPDWSAIYLAWVNSGYTKELAPSIDRLDDYNGYSFNNIRLVPWYINNTKGKVDRYNGVNNKVSKAVIQLRMDGVFIAEYPSIAIAARTVGASEANITKVCKQIPVKKGINSDGSIRYSTPKSCKGFIWRFK